MLKPKTNAIINNAGREILKGNQRINKKYSMGFMYSCMGGILSRTYACNRINKMNRIIFFSNELMD